MHEQRQYQNIKSIKYIPPVDWRKAEEMIQYEGVYIFGGIHRRYKDIIAETNDKLYILAVLPSDDDPKTNELKFRCIDDMEVKPKGRPPSGRYDHAILKIRNYVAIFGGRKLPNDGGDSL